MERKTYIYWAIPSFTLLSCVPSLFSGLLPSLAAIIISALVVLLCWSITWLRFYQSKALRPEFAILSILPMLIYILTRTTAAESFEYFISPTWQNAYFFIWLASGIVLFYSFAPSLEERGSLKGARDSVRSIMTLVTAVYIISSLFSTNRAIFGILAT